MPLSIGQPKGPSSCGVISRVATNGAGHADRGLRKIPSRIASPSTNGPRLSTAEPRAAIGRVTSSFVSAHGRCSFCMSANRASRSPPGSLERPPLRSFRSCWQCLLGSNPRCASPSLSTMIPSSLSTPCCEPCAPCTWFCDAYASWQKGGVENANGRLRRWLPRQIDIDQVSDEEIQDIVITANLTPRKCLGFKTPFQAILKELGKDVQIRFS